MYTTHRASLVSQAVQGLPATQETQVQSLDQEDTLEKGMAVHFSILTWRIPSTAVPVRLHRVAKSQTQLSNFHFRLLRSAHKHMICKNVVQSCFPTFQKTTRENIIIFHMSVFKSKNYIHVFICFFFNFILVLIGR